MDINIARKLTDSPEILKGLKDGTYEVFGGVIRKAKGQEGAGQIIKHILFPSDSQDKLNELQNVLHNGIGSISDNLEVIKGLQAANIALSGLNLVVSTVGFSVVCNKLDSVNKILNHHSDKLDCLIEASATNKLKAAIKESTNFKSVIEEIDSCVRTNNLKKLDSLSLEIRRIYNSSLAELTQFYIPQLAKNSNEKLPLFIVTSQFRERWIHAGFSLAKVYYLQGYYEESVMVIDQIQKNWIEVNKQAVKILTENKKIASLTRKEYEAFEGFVKERRKLEPAMEYQKNLLLLVKDHPELRYQIDNHKEIMLIAA